MEKEIEKIYLSGPISGFDLTERERIFNEKEKKFKSKGFDVFNCFKNGVPLSAPATEHLKADMKVLPDCDTVYFMKGWEKSSGCNLEFNVAHALKLKMIFEK